MRLIRKLGRLVFAVTAVAVIAFSVLLLLETLGAFWMWQRVRFDPLIHLVQENTVERDVPTRIQMPDRWVLPEYNYAEPGGSTTRPNARTRDMALQESLDERWFGAFVELGETERNTVAIFQQMGVIGLRADLSVGCAYGVHEARRKAEVDILKKRNNGSFHPPDTSNPCLLKVQEGSVSCLLQAAESSEHPGVKMYFFYQMGLLRNSDVETNPDSLWQIPFFQYKPNIHREFHSINRFGFRGPDVDVPKPQGVFRILCIGGSTTEEGPADDRTYPGLLQQRLRDSFPGHAIEVVNCGVSGMTLAAHTQRFKAYAALEPDLLLFYEGVNDIAHEIPAVWFGSKARDWQRYGWYSRFLRNFMADYLMPDLDTIRALVRENTIEIMDALRQMAPEFNAAMIVCSIARPDMKNISWREWAMYDYLGRNPSNLFNNMTGTRYCEAIDVYNDELRTWCRERHVPYMPVAENITGGAGCFNDLCHMRPPAIERKAEIIAMSMKEWLARYFAEHPGK